MTGNPIEISAADLHAYVDGKLDAERAKVVESYLLEHPKKAKEIQAWQEQNQTLKALYDHVAIESIPNRLRPSVLASHKDHSPIRWQAIAAALVFFMLGSAIGWFGKDLTAHRNVAAMTLVDEAITAHSVYAIEVRHPVEVTAKEQVHLVGWLSKRLGTRISAPDLTGKGFELVGGRLLPAKAGPAAQFMYEDNSGLRITLYATRNRSNQLAAFQFSTDADYNAFYWLDATISYALVGNVPRKALKGLAIEVYRQLA